LSNKADKANKNIVIAIVAQIDVPKSVNQDPDSFINKAVTGPITDTQRRNQKVQLNSLFWYKLNIVIGAKARTVLKLINISFDIEPLNILLSIKDIDYHVISEDHKREARIIEENTCYNLSDDYCFLSIVNLGLRECQV
tara:strand:+ start:573 stop:989 length:417 start_codon:yes stop_codon:yes gene_type:complete